MKNSKEIFERLPENEKLKLIEKIMPCSGTFRQLDQNMFSESQYDEMYELFFNSIDWAQGIEIDEICVHDKVHVVNGQSDLGNDYEACGYYSDGILLFIEDIEHSI